MITNTKYLGDLLSPLDFDNKSFEERQSHIEDLLCRSLNMRTVVAFIGSGASFPIGYPMWGQFAKDTFKLLKITLSTTNGEYENCLAIKLRNNPLSEHEEAVIVDFASVFFPQSVKDGKLLEDLATEIKTRVEKYIEFLGKRIKKNYPDENDEKDLKTLATNYNEEKIQDKINQFSAYLDKKKSKEIDFQSLFSECERLICSKERWEELRHAKFFRVIVESYFQIKRYYTTLDNKDKLKAKEWNPYLALLDLPINKFATFNYDLEIERALLFGNNKQKDKIYADKTKGEQIIKYVNSSNKIRSFSQKNKYCEDLVGFSVSGFEPKVNSVFHCHGRIDDTINCVVSEEDYQKWYLQEDDEKYTPFRQTLDIILESNPILFMGFSLSDSDFMRILRSISANRTGDKTRKPLFCLLYVRDSDFENNESCVNAENAKWTDEKELEDECTMLYIKYGLHVILVEEEKLNSKDDKPIEPTCHKLMELEEKAKEWWQGVTKKPKFRKFEINADKPYFHYEFDEGAVEIIKFDDNLYKELDKALGFENTPETPGSHPEKDDEFPELKPPELKKYFAPNLAVVVGDGGTGKSWSVQQYLKSKIRDGKISEQKTFFWSSYYTNDVLTGIDRLVDFFTEGKEDKADNPEWVDEILLNKDNPKYGKFAFLKLIIDRNEDAIIVFDGIEKLLTPNTDNTEGESISPEVREFFKILTNRKVKSKIILTTRLFPSDILFNIDEIINNQTDYDEKRRFLELKNNQIKRGKILSAPRCWAELLNKGEYLKVNSDYVKSIGNNLFYSNFCSLFDGHIFAIAIMRGILEGLDKNKIGTKLLLDNIIKTPMERRVNEVIKEAIAHLDTPDSKIYKRFVERISLFMHPVRKEVAEICFNQISENERISRSLTTDDVLNILVKKSLVQVVKINDDTRYVVHPLIRSYVFETLHESKFASLPGLQLPGVTSSKEVVDPGNKIGQEVSLKLFEKLCKEAEEKVSETKPISNENYLIASDMCRAAFSIMRSRFCTNTVARWGNYTKYIKKLILLSDTTKRVSKDHWDYNEPTSLGLKLSSAQIAPLYSDELAWLYNEIGIATYNMGYFIYSAAILGEGFEINRLIDREFEGRYTFQSNLNKGSVNLHYGKLDTAIEYLKKAHEVASKLNSDSLVGRVIGYTAMVKYLRGNLEEANSEFTMCYETLKDNLRAKSWFLIVHGELLLKLGKLDEAFEKIEQSRHIAESVYYPDLVAYAKLARANYYVEKDEHVKAQNDFQYVLQFAKERHMRRMEAGNLSGMSRLAEKLGDYSISVDRAVKALKISNEYTIRLHQTLSLKVLGIALINGNQHRNLGIACLKTAKRMAQKQEYFLRLNEIEEELLKLNIENK